MYPIEVQKRINILKKYKENPELNEFDIIHMYPDGLAYPNGFYDCQFFNVVGFNWDKMEKRCLGRHDRVNPVEGVVVKYIGIFADGSTWVRFEQPVKIMFNTQDLELYPLDFEYPKI